MTVSLDLEAEVLAAVSSIDDPEYPGVSIVDLGLLEELRVTTSPGGNAASATIGLIPTFSGCPALAMIAGDVERAVLAVDGVEHADVTWLRSPVWTPERVSERGRSALAETFTVSVQIGGGPPRCPRCAAPTVEQSMFGPSRCRAVHRCDSCSETIEVMRS